MNTSYQSHKKFFTETLTQPTTRVAGGFNRRTINSGNYFRIASPTSLITSPTFRRAFPKVS
jgi:hypothetical protein